MYSRRTSLKTPTDFRFPFEPYGIQQNLMESLYEVIENGHIGIFESPTGTGKSLTLTCGALKWLEDHNNLLKSELNQRINEVSKEIEELELEASGCQDWIQAQFGSIQKKDEVNALKKSKNLLEEYEEKIKELRERRTRVKLKDLAKGRKQGATVVEEEGVPDEDLALGDYETDKPEQDDLENEKDQYKDVKIYFCSRTHSQLAQIAREIKRTDYAKDTRCISLASRQNLCINPSVTKLQSSALINERCLDMQKSQSRTTSSDTDGRPQKKSRTSQQARCPYKAQLAVEELRDASLVEIADIEDLVSAGEALKACPYYSSRSAVKDAQIVLLPYQMLLHRKTRIQTGIELENSVVIIDEAHNLLDTMSDIYSSQISLAQLQLAQQQLVGYKTKYCSRFNATNLLKINQLIFITKRLIKLLTPSDTTCSSRMLRTHELMSEGEFFNIDLFQILEFAEQTRLAQKVQGHAQREEQRKPIIEKENELSSQKGLTGLLRRLEEEQLQKKLPKSKRQEIQAESDAKEEEKKPVRTEAIPSVIRPLLAFLECLTECSDDGQVLMHFDSDPKKSGMKFLLLNPSGHFNELVRKCRAVIIAGGTMRPTGELVDQLFRSCPERVKEYFYDHVVPAEAVLPFTVCRGPTGKKFNFSFTNRNNTEMILELGMTLQNICNVVPAGVICFFSSYDYLEQVYKLLVEKQVIANIEKKKYVFREPRAAGQQVERILGEYAVAIADTRRQGAILFSVVGGKLSEGLNFADDLGRCVVVVGMPYPNKNTPELQEKMRYLENTLMSGAGAEYYDNLCMKAVNQCIGRSVRHINDYATVLLVDERYNSDRVRNKLPQWISRNLKTPPMFGMIQGAVAKFFRDRRKT
ncbi:unnamed protein product [Hermetia illucens]|uniref:DNA 5'-3' helicase n=1 Tax=Hermetia illucens TaxID=343691 RepID=A0A7R8UUA5_HERIL|nr:ATP-dependent DNA helicase DDX11 [Hermetia illucens]CAD7086728.1 unnamed protein product [Hermetia illucens]